MADGPPIDMEWYRGLKRVDSTASNVYRLARENGLGKLDGIRITRELFALSFEEAKAIVRDANLPIDRSPYELAPVRNCEELEQVLKAELGFCGCAAYEDSIELLRDVLRHARDWQDALLKEMPTQPANDLMLQRLRFEQVPGLATWFLYLLDERGMVEHAGRVTTCWITTKGRQLLEAIERWYPSVRTTDQDDMVERSDSADPAGI